MNAVFAIALNTFREAARNKVLYSLLFFAVLMISSALALGQLSMHEELRVTRDLGLGGIAFFGVMIAIFIGVNLVYKEIDRKTIFVIIAKPIRRSEFIVGKFVGMALTLAVQFVVMAAVLFLVLYLQSGSQIINWGALFRAVLLQFVQIILITGVAVLFSSFSSPFLSGAFTFGIYLLGCNIPDIRILISKIDWPQVAMVFNFALKLLPNLSLFFISGTMLEGQYVSVHNSYVSWSYVGVASLYGLFYAAATLLVASLLFTRRDFI